ncbi:hypothetical protein DPMN_042509 [Dreissena polymorpha]|uniref:Uncharacterized protein n=1 Tax=Dreissena polymorpha TaxID=45954 RepID=A0A9D4D259_DREPO|nr:hypothetical protein DPMN_042509 [Dreissena polymorpha]
MGLVPDALRSCTRTTTRLRREPAIPGSFHRKAFSFAGPIITQRAEHRCWDQRSRCDPGSMNLSKNIRLLSLIQRWQSCQSPAEIPRHSHVVLPRRFLSD